MPSDYFIGEIRSFCYNFVPRGWAACNGQALAISQYQSLFSLIGTTYGGDGRTNFQLPRLNGRTPMGQGTGPGLTPRRLGQRLGEPTVTLGTNQLPPHNHSVSIGKTAADSSSVTADVSTFAATSRAGDNHPVFLFSAETTDLVPMSNGVLSMVGGAPHENMQPYLAIGYFICLDGVYPSRP